MLFFIQCSPYKTVEETLQSATVFLDKQTIPKNQLCFVLSYPQLKPFSEKFKDSGIQFCSDEMLDPSFDSFTGSISGSMLKQSGAQFVLIGSRKERESGKKPLMAKEKIAQAIASALVPILAVGENFHEWEENQSKETLDVQLKEALADIPKEQLTRLLILYEAPWVKRIPSDVALSALPDRCTEFKKAAEAFLPSENSQCLYSILSNAPEFFECLKPFSPAGYFQELKNLV